MGITGIHDVFFGYDRRIAVHVSLVQIDDGANIVESSDVFERAPVIPSKCSIATVDNEGSSIGIRKRPPGLLQIRGNCCISDTTAGTLRAGAIARRW